MYAVKRKLLNTEEKEGRTAHDEWGVDGRCALLIFMGFLFTSSGYLSWMYHLLEFFSPQKVDVLTMGAGYLLQAAGLGLFALSVRRFTANGLTQLFTGLSVAGALCLIPALLGGTVGSVVFGFIYNLLCGGIAGAYLHAMTVYGTGRHRGMIFGVGYAAATLTSWLLSLPGKGSFLTSRSMLWFYFVMAALLICAYRQIGAPASGREAADPASACAQEAQEAREGRPDASASTDPRSGRRTLILICMTVFLMSLVNNMGFSFPAEDIQAGVSLELTRILYAGGLLVAGLMADRDRRYGAACAMAALVGPFIVLALSGEAVVRPVLWGIDYFIFGFFAVYRVVVFADLAVETKKDWLCVCGLLFGRLGDVAGFGLTSALAASVSLVVLCASGFFILTAIAFFRLYQELYVPSLITQRSEKEIFEHFCLRHDLSVREKEVLRLLLADRTNAAIAQELFVSESTVKFHVHNLFLKTGCKNRSELKAEFARQT